MAKFQLIPSGSERRAILPASQNAGSDMRQPGLTAPAPGPVGSEKVFRVSIAESAGAETNYVFFDQNGYIRNNNGSPITTEDFDDGSTFGSNATAVNRIIENMFGSTPALITRLRITLPSGVTTFPGTIKVGRGDLTGNLELVPLDSTANQNPFYDNTNVVDFVGLNFLVDSNSGIWVNMPAGTAQTHTFTFYVSAIGNNYRMRAI